MFKLMLTLELTNIQFKMTAAVVTVMKTTPHCRTVLQDMLHSCIPSDLKLILTLYFQDDSSSCVLTHETSRQPLTVCFGGKSSED